jgi:cell division protein FtsN
MNRILFTLLLSIGIYSGEMVAQNNQKQPIEKPSTDACPTWNNKSSGSKADYFMFLRKSPKAAKTIEIARYNQRNKDFNKAVYTSLVPQKAVPANEPEEEPQEEKSETKIEQSQKIPVVIPPVNIQPLQIKETQPAPPALPEVKKEKTETTDSKSPSEKVEVIEKDKKLSKHHFFSFHKHERKHWLRKLKFRKKGAAKCPDF